MKDLIKGQQNSHDFSLKVETSAHVWQGLALGASFMIMAIGGIVAPQIVCGLLSHVSHKGY